MTVSISQGKFIINGRDVFLFGGEFHYFRVPKQDWESRLDLLISAGCNLVSTYIPWVWHETEEGGFDFTGQTRPETDLQSFLELVAAKGLYCIVRPGPYVMAEVRYEGIPEWLLNNYPEVIAKQPDGREHPARVVSYQHPLFLEKVAHWYEAVNQVIAPKQSTHGGPIIMYQLCNEIGMLHWVTNTSDYNASTLQEFARYLANQYQCVETFNQTYTLNISSFESFAETFRLGQVPGLHFEWGRFWRFYINGYVGKLREIALETGINVPFIINVHGFKDYSIYSRGVDYPIGLSQLYATTEFSDVILAGDFYPGHIGYDNYHDLVLSSAFTKAISSADQPLFSAEFQSGRLADRPRIYPQDLDLNTRTCVAHGMNALNYYMFVAGENYDNIGLFGRRHEWQAPIDSQGNTRPNYAKAQHLGHLFQTVGQRLLAAPKKVHTFVGFNPDDYMTETIEDHDSKIIGEIISKREHYAFDGILRLLVSANIQFEAVNLLKEIILPEVPTLWVFSTNYMDLAVQQRLVDYVQQGGKLVLYPEVPAYDLTGKPCRVLADELELGEWQVVPGISTVDVLDIDSVMVKQRLRFTKFSGEIIAAYQSEGERQVAAYKKQAGKGEILVLGLGMGQDYHYQLAVIKKIAGLMGIYAHLSSTNSDLSLVERRSGDDSFIFVTNYDEVEQTGVICENGDILFENLEITLPPRSGIVLLRDYQLKPGITVQYSTVELTAITETTNELRLKVTPIGQDGVLKLKLSDQWQCNVGLPVNGELMIDKIDSPLSIVFSQFNAPRE